MAFRDDTEALRAHVESLQGELDDAKAAIAELSGHNHERPELPPPKKGWNRRVRSFPGNIESEAYERIVQELRIDVGQALQTSHVGRILSASSPGLEVSLTPIGDEIVMVFDEYPPRTGAVAVGVGMAIVGLLASLGIAVDGGAMPGLIGLSMAIAASMVVTVSVKRNAAVQQEKYDALFVRLGALLQSRTSRVRVESDPVAATFEEEAEERVHVDVDVASEI